MENHNFSCGFFVIFEENDDTMEKPNEILELEKKFSIIIENTIDINKIENYESFNLFYVNENYQIIGLKLYRNFFTEIPDLSSFHHLEILNLGSNKITEINKLDKLTKLKKLYLGANFISNINNLDHLTDLKYLDLEINQILEIENLDNLIKLETLSLHNNKITKIKNLEYLTSLKELYLSSNQIEDIVFKNELPLLEYLNLDNNLLKEVTEIGKLINLEILIISGNKIENLKGLENLKKIRELNLGSNNIENIEQLKNFNHLDFINLYNNKVKDITPLKNISINELYIGGNLIIDISSLYFSLKSKKIVSINVNDNQNLRYPNEEIASKGTGSIIKWFDDIINRCNQKIEKADEILDLGMMGLTDLSLIPNLFKLENLEELVLSNVWAEYDHVTNEWNPVPSKNSFYVNNICNIPDEIKNLKNLKKLIIGGDWKKGNQWNRWRINDCSFINKLDKIEYVNLSNNSIETFKITKELNHLKTIHINNNNIKSISLSRARNLEYLFASNNKIENLNFLVKSLSLKALDLHSNIIKDLSPVKVLIEKIGIVNSQWEYDTISIAKNNLENPGIEVIDRGKEEVIKMMKINYGVKTFKNNELKLILVGNSETGKTTLTKYLANDPKYKEKHSFTLWMDILKINYGNVKINIFDFGGHEYFHDTHHIFFSKNSIYFLLWNKSTDEYRIRELNQIDENKNPIKLQTIDYPLSYWIDSINHFIKEKDTDNFSDEMKKILRDNYNSIEYQSSTLIIQNKVNNREDQKFLNQYDLLEKYSFIFNFINIDIHNEKNISLLDENLGEMISKIGDLSGGRYPLYYRKIKENIEQFKSYLNKKVINFNEFKRLCQSFKRELTSDDEYIRIAAFLKDIGLILMSQDKSIFYLDLNFVSRQIVKIYDGLQNISGSLTESEIKAKNIDEYENVIKLILDYNLAFELNKNGEKNYIFPLYLPKEPNKLVELLLRENSKIYKRIQYEGFMHKGIILHIFSEYSNKIVTEQIDKNTYFWKNGLIVKENNDLVLIKFFEGNESNNAFIDLYNFGEDEVFVKTINDKVIELNKINNYKIEEYVTNDGANFIPLKLINTNEEVNSIIIYNDKKYNLNNFTKYFKNKKLMKKVFISYSHSDSEDFNRLLTFLKPLEKSGKISIWQDLKLKAGTLVTDEILKKLEDSDIVIMLISQDFISSDFIFDNELPKAMKKKLQSSGSIIPVVLTSSTIFDLDLNVTKDDGTIEAVKMGKYYFIPQDSKNNLLPIKHWGDKTQQDVAWKKVYDEIVKLL